MNPHRRLLLIIALFVMIASTALAGAPGLINYQGRLTNALGIPVADGSHDVTFAIYNAPTGGTYQWLEDRTVTTVDGLFSITLGELIPLSQVYLTDTALYLGIRLGSDPEMTPRTRLTSVPYAVSARSTLATNNNGTARISTDASPSYSFLKLSDTLGWTRAMLAAYEHSGGVLSLKRGDASATPYLYASTGSGRALLAMFNSQFTPKVILDPDSTGDVAVMLPDSSISKAEILDEPGLAFNHNTSSVTMTGSVADLVTASFTAPADGYVLITGKGNAYLSGTTGTNFGYAQIDNTPGGAIQNPYRAVFGSNAMGTTASQFIPFAVTRVFAVTGGANFTYRLEGCYGGSQGAGAVIDVRDAMIQVAYFPTLYGTATTLVSAEEAGRFETAVPVALDGETMYEVDLRELELKAVNERLKAEQAEAEAARAEATLERARREEAEKQLRELSDK